MTASGLAGIGELDRVHERLRNLSTVLPVFAQELAASRRQAARLRVENARLVEEVSTLRRELAARERAASATVGGELLAGAGATLDRDRRGDRGAALRV